MKLTHFAVAGLAVALAAAVYLTLNADMDGRMEQLQANSDRQMQELQRSIKDLKNQQAQAASPAAPAKEAVAAVADTLKGAGREVKEAGENLAKDLQKDANDRIAKAKTAVEEGIEDKANGAVRKGEELVNEAAERLRSGARDIADAAGTKAREVGAAIDDKVQIEPPLLDDPADPEAARIAREERNVLNANGIGMDRVALETAVAANAVPEGKTLNSIQSLIASQPAIARIKHSEKDGYVVLDAGMNAKLMKGDRFAVRRGTAIIARVTIGDTILATESVADITANSLVTGMVLEPGDEIIKFDR